jgi:hypothetical protein
MKKSNEPDFRLPHEQASRLVQLFAPSFDTCLMQSADNGGKPIVWHPVLRDIHEQVVHAVSPVLIESRQQPGEVSPNLSLSLLPAPSGATRLQSAQEQSVVPDELTPTVKTSL